MSAFAIMLGTFAAILFFIIATIALDEILTRRRKRKALAEHNRHMEGEADQ